MRRLFEIARIILISPEIVVLPATVAALQCWPKLFIFVGESFTKKEKLWEYIPVIPVGAFIYVIGLATRLHTPEDKAKRELFDWDLFWKLKYRILVMLLWALLAAGASLVLWTCSTDLDPKTVGAVFLASLVLALMTAATGFLALFSLHEILAKE